MTQPTRAEYDQVMIPCYKPADLVMTHGKKCRLYDSQNRSYLDFGGGIAVNSLGNAPKIVPESTKRKALSHQQRLYERRYAETGQAAHFTHRV